LTAFSPELAAIRFGTGRSPQIADPVSAEAMLAALQQPDAMAQKFPIEGLAAFAPKAQAFAKVRQSLARGEIDKAQFRKEQDTFRLSERSVGIANQGMILARGMATTDGFRERLVLFWADHFTVIGKALIFWHRADTLAEDAIRPNLTGRFADLLRAAELHPLMLQYLDQSTSVGPESAFAGKHPDAGLNENLAREMMELHSIGVTGHYTQKDVRQSAELLAGLGIDENLHAVFRPGRSEPGPETVLDFSSGKGPGNMKDIDDFLEYLGTHPDTAHYISWKLAVHFVADDPDPALVAAMEAKFKATGGQLMEVYEVMLTHPAGLDPTLRKVKRPVDFLISAMRALQTDPDALVALARDKPGRFNQLVMAPMRRMGQPWNQPAGPDGWPEAADAWITPGSLAERIQWGMGVDRLPGAKAKVEPANFMTASLGPLAGSDLNFAVKAAETRSDGIGMTLVSPEFQRR